MLLWPLSRLSSVPLLLELSPALLISPATTYLVGTAQNVYDNPSLQGGLTYTIASGFYAATFASTINFGEGLKEELDFFAGKKWPVKQTTVDLSVASINYPNSPTPINFVEYDLKLDHPLGKGNVGAWFGYTEHFFNVYGVGYWTEAHASRPLTDRLSVSGSIASQALPNHFDYRSFNVGATYQLTSHYGGDLQYSNTDRHDLDPVFKTYNGQFSATVTASF